MVLPCNMGKVIGNDYNPEGQEGQEKRGEWVLVVEVGSMCHGSLSINEAPQKDGTANGRVGSQECQHGQPARGNMESPGPVGGTE